MVVVAALVKVIIIGVIIIITKAHNDAISYTFLGIYATNIITK